MVAAALLPFYDPIRLAEDMAVLDHISNGRVSYVFGLGYRAEEFALYDLEMDRARIADEKLRAARHARRETGRRSRGRGGQGHPRPWCAERAVDHVGGRRPRRRGRQAQYGLDFFAQTDGDDPATAYYDECEKQGHPPGNLMLPSPATPSTIFVTDDVDRAWGARLVPPARRHHVRGVEPAGRHRELVVRQDRRRARRERCAPRVDRRRSGRLGSSERLPRLAPAVRRRPARIAWPYLRRVTDEVLPAAAAP